MPVIPQVKFPSKRVIEKVVVINASEITVTNETLTLPEYFEVETQDIPEVGDLVRVGFYYNDSSQPYIDGFA
jgi:ribosomal protein L13